jgi:hypothetical protein
MRRNFYWSKIRDFTRAFTRAYTQAFNLECVIVGHRATGVKQDVLAVVDQLRM